jgi:hypothetical protein
VRDAAAVPDRRVPNPRVGLIFNVRKSQSEEIRGVLASVGVASLAVATHEQATAMVAWYPFTFVLGPLPPFAPIHFIEAVRGAGSLCRNTGFVLLAEDHEVSVASSFVGRGVNRVVAFTEAAERLPKVVADLGKVSQRLTVKLKVQVDGADGNRLGQWRSVNISSSGILLQTNEKLAAGSQLDLRFSVPEDPLPIQVQAEVVRSATFGRESFAGLGLRFLSFVGEGQHRLDSFLYRHLAS